MLAGGLVLGAMPAQAEEAGSAGGGAPPAQGPAITEPAPSAPVPAAPMPPSPSPSPAVPAPSPSPAPSPPPAPDSDASGEPDTPTQTCDDVPVGEDDRHARDACLEARHPAEAERYRASQPNPDLAEMCGADVALVLDRSRSIGAAGMEHLKRAADDFTGALLDTGSQASVTSFADDGEALANATALDDQGTEAVQSSYARLRPDGWTNWARGLREARLTFDGFDGGAADLAIVITDGNPNTVTANQPGRFPDGSTQAVNPAITQANVMKARGTHVLVVAVGELDLAPIVAISGDEEFTGDNLATAGYVTTDSYETLAQDLKRLALALCGAQVIIDKLIDGEHIPDWTFSARSSDLVPASQKTGDDGMTEAFEVSGFTGPTRVVAFQEEARPFYRMVGVTCDGEVSDLDADSGVWSVEVGAGETVRCSVQNVGNPEWTVTQRADPPSGTAVRPGDRIDYTLTVRHEGGPTATDLVILDDISGLAPNATFEGFVGRAPSAVDWDEREPGRLELVVDELDPGQQLEFTYRVTVREDLRPGDVLRSRVLTNCPPSIPEIDPCATVHPTPGYVLWKSANPGDGATVQPGSVIEYTLHAWNMFGETPVIDATAVDDLSGVLEHAQITGPLDPALHLDGEQLTWDLPELPVGSEPVTVSFEVEVDADAWNVELENVAVHDDQGVCPTPMLRAAAAARKATAGEDDVASGAGVAGILGRNACHITHRTPDVELTVTKAADPGTDRGEPVDSGASPADTIEYEIVIENLGDDPAYVVDAEDLLPQGVSIVAETVEIVTSPDPHQAEQWTFSEPSLGRAQFSLPGPFMPGDRATITFTAEVGTIEHPDPASPIPDLVNQICVSHAAPPVDGESSSTDRATSSDPVCATASTPVKSVALQATAMCVADAPWLDYRVTPTNVDAATSGALIWWTPEAFAARNPAIPAADTAALLADGASQVDRLELPADRAPGEVVSGRRLWPGAAVDPTGSATEWPGWTLRPDGTWALDPAAPFYDLREAAVVEVRVNPSTAVVAVYPPSAPDCHPGPPSAAPSGTSGGHASGPARTIAHTGFDGTPFALIGIILALLGLGAVAVSARSSRRTR
jgi:uncharacterized repeat protein (TIGR01451 family)